VIRPILLAAPAVLPNSAFKASATAATNTGPSRTAELGKGFPDFDRSFRSFFVKDIPSNSS
jgi:hypothetical protein